MILNKNIQNNSSQNDKNMAKIIIKNIGPIKEAEFDLNKINVFMGPQSSGKSTIAKIISFCTWLDKKYARDGFFSVIKDENIDIPDYIQELKTYHRLTNGYFSDNSEIFFDGEEICFTYNCEFPENTNTTMQIEQESKIKIGLKTGKRRQSSKVIYIPSERNFVSSIYNLNEYLRDRDLIQDFVSNWYEAKRKYSKEHKLKILDLGVEYYNEGEDVDKLLLKTGEELTLQIASSGLQAVVPLITLLDYIARGIYHELRPMSVADRDLMIKKYNEMVKQLREEGSKISTSDLQTLFDLIISKNYTQSQIIIEEPEQNLFPEAQRDLIYYIFKLFNDTKRDHRLTFTTHSPYILYALNNCMMGYLVKDSMPEDEISELKSKNSWINPDLVSVWEIENGNIRPIKNNETGTISKHYFNGIMNDVMEEYYDMLTYLNLKDNEG